MNDKIICLRQVSKRYQIFDNPRSRLAHSIYPKYIRGMEEIWALKEINIEVEQGESIAVIGRNGGGKSTLLEIISGILTPTSGEVTIHGRISALLELGSGFNPEYSGRDNIILNGLLLGLSRQDILNRFDDIVSFAEIGAALDRPVKTYSTGMLMRLAFAVQVLCQPSILIIDEALSVGDFFFQQKCLSTIRELHRKGTTLLFVSHDMGTVRDLCSRVIYLKQGHVAFDGPVSQGIRLFFNETTTKNKPDPIPISLEIPREEGLQSIPPLVDVPSIDAIWTAQKPPSFGKLNAVALYNADGLPTTSFQLGETMVLRVKFMAYPGIVNHIGLILYDKFSSVRTTTGSMYLNVLPQDQESAIRVFELQMKLMIEAGQYGLMVTLSYETAKNRGQRLDETGMIGPITVNWDYEKETAPFLGQVGLPVSAEYLLS